MVHRFLVRLEAFAEDFHIHSHAIKFPNQQLEMNISAIQDLFEKFVFGSVDPPIGP